MTPVSGHSSSCHGCSLYSPALNNNNSHTRILCEGDACAWHKGRAAGAHSLLLGVMGKPLTRAAALAVEYKPRPWLQVCAGAQHAAGFMDAKSELVVCRRSTAAVVAWRN